MAYVLGFWFADGYMRHEKSYRIVFTSNDDEILFKIRQSLSSNNLIKSKKSDDSKDLIIFSKRLYDGLLKLGGKRAKSRSIVFPKIPDEYLSDFIRGYFDGDGSVFHVTYMHTKIKRLRTELRSNFTSGSINFLEQLQNILFDKLGLTKKKIGSFNDGRSRKLGYATYDTIKLLKFMYYPGHPIGLQRKAKFLHSSKTQSFIRKYDYFSAIDEHNWKNSIRTNLKIL